MQPHPSSPPHGRRPPPPTAVANEFAEAAARLFEKRSKAWTDGVSAPSVFPDDREERGGSARSFLSSLQPGRSLLGALWLVPFAVVGFLAVWYLRFEPPPPAPANRVMEAKAEPARVANVVRPSPPPVRQQVVETKPAPPIEQAIAPAPPPAPSPPTEVASTPLSRNEIKELQGKLGAIGFGPGPIDGVVGPQTQAAVRRYAQSRNLPKPEATREVLSRLRTEPPATQ